MVSRGFPTQLIKDSSIRLLKRVETSPRLVSPLRIQGVPFLSANICWITIPVTDFSYRTKLIHTKAYVPILSRFIDQLTSNHMNISRSYTESPGQFKTTSRDRGDGF